MPKPDQLTGVLLSFYQSVSTAGELSKEELDYLISLDSENVFEIFNFLSYLGQKFRKQNEPEQNEPEQSNLEQSKSEQTEPEQSKTEQNEPEKLEQNKPESKKAPLPGYAAFNDQNALSLIYFDYEQENYKKKNTSQKLEYHEQHIEEIVAKQCEPFLDELVKGDVDKNGLGKFYDTSGQPYAHFLKSDNMPYGSNADLISDFLNGTPIYAYKVGDELPRPVKMAFDYGKAVLTIGEPIKAPKTVDKPGGFTRFLAFFGHKASKKKIEAYNTYQKELADYKVFGDQIETRRDEIETHEKPYIPKKPKQQKAYSEMLLEEKINDVLLNKNSWENVESEELYFRIAKEYLSYDKTKYEFHAGEGYLYGYSDRIQELARGPLSNLGKVDTLKVENADTRAVNRTKSFYKTMAVSLGLDAEDATGEAIGKRMVDLGKRIFWNALCTGREDMVEAIVKKHVLDTASPRESLELKQYLENGSLSDKRNLRERDYANGKVSYTPSMNEMRNKTESWFKKHNKLDPVTAYVGMAAYDRIMEGGDYDAYGELKQCNPTAEEQALKNTCKIIRDYSNLRVRLFNGVQNDKNKALEGPIEIGQKDLNTIGSYQLLAGAFVQKAPKPNEPKEEEKLPFVINFYRESANRRDIVGSDRHTYDAETIVKRAVEVTMGTAEEEKTDDGKRAVPLDEFVSMNTDPERIGRSFKSTQHTIGMQMAMIFTGKEKRDLVEDEIKNIQEFTDLEREEIISINKTWKNPKPGAKQNQNQLSEEMQAGFGFQPTT